MTASGPGTDRFDTQRLVGRLDPLGSARGIVLAVSGGPDSTALMHLAAAWRAVGTRPPIAVASVDHGLRPGSRAEADDVVEAAHQLGFPATRLTWTGDKPRRGVAERARIARYGLLAGHAGAVGASHIVAAHTLDDQAETVLLRMARGSGIGGLGAMRRISQVHGFVLARPLLDVRKAELVALCEAQRWPFVEDPSNRDSASARARWRKLEPVLSREGMTPERLAVLARRMARADAALDHATTLAERAASLDTPGPGRRYDMAMLSGWPDEVALRVLGRGLAAVSAKPSPKLERLEALAADLANAAGSGQALRRTLHHCLVTLDERGRVSISREGQRLRGTRSALAATFGPGSLGKATPASYIADVDAPARQPDVVETHCTSDASARAVLLSAGRQ